SADVRADGYRVAVWHSWVQVMWVLPVLFLAVVTWIVARMAVSGEITVPEMVAVYLYVTTLLVPVSFLVESADSVPRALVSARRVVELLALRPDEGERAAGIAVQRGALTVVVSADAEAAREVVEPLGLVADNDDYLFRGTVREAVSVAQHDELALEQAVWAAAAVDVVEALPDGLESQLEAQGRNVSGGQRQRLRLVRALLSAPEVLVLVEPTSALDAVTEGVVARRVKQVRDGRTTVVVSSSPLWVGQADHVVRLDPALEESR
ncbi:ABC transporter ATP-binding protein, partial [Nocardia sp. NRRL S-836]|uniref:ATP-binding cassette domain-containing protein n=1 Tax=Nocardia sp. NRRL S-836 TaxID=1519492 RepID=UPI000A89A538